MGLLQEFKAFAMRGNVLDMAVGVIMGTAFGKVVSSLVSDVVMPPIGKLIGGVNFSDLKLSLGKLEEKAADGAVTIKEASVNYGVFLQTIFDFLIVAVAVFAMIKLMNKATSALKKEQPAAPTTKECPRCCSTIAIKATRCPNCTADIG